MNEIFEKTSWLEVVVEKQLAESSALRESDRVVADRRRLAIIVWMSNLLSLKKVRSEIGFGSPCILVLVFHST